MKLKIQAVQRKEMPSKFGGVWTITSVKLEGIENPQFGFELKGYGKLSDKYQAGDTIQGYMGTYSYQGKDTLVVKKTFNKITPEYVYDLLLKMNPSIESEKGVPAPKDVKPETSEWGEEESNEPIF